MPGSASSSIGHRSTTSCGLVGLADAAVAGLPPPPDSDHSLVACPSFRVGDNVIRTIGIAARFDTALEVTLDELRIELIYPQDATAERFFRDHAPHSPTRRQGDGACDLQRLMA